MCHNDERDKKPDPRAVERRLFGGLMRTKTLPIVPDQTPNNIPDSQTSKQPSQPSFADGSLLLQELKRELLAKGMSDDKAEAYLRTI